MITRYILYHYNDEFNKYYEKEGTEPGRPRKKDATETESIRFIFHHGAQKKKDNGNPQRKRRENERRREKNIGGIFALFPTGAASPRTTRGVSPAEIPHRALQMP